MVAQSCGKQTVGQCQQILFFIILVVAIAVIVVVVAVVVVVGVAAQHYLCHATM